MLVITGALYPADMIIVSNPKECYDGKNVSTGRMDRKHRR